MAETTVLDSVPIGFAGKSGVSWGAILAGAAVAIAASLILLALGGGLEFASISPWPGRGASATAFTVYTAIWLIVVQWVSAALGGYIAGRLRTRWVGTHTHEVFFRDTAHGLITWSVAALFAAGVLASSASGLVGGGLRALGGAGAASAGAHFGAAGGGEHAGATGPGAGGAEPGQGMPSDAMPSGAMPMPPGPGGAMAYDVDKLFRPAAGEASGNPPPAAAEAGDSGDARIEAMYIGLHAIATRSFPEPDRAYLAQLVQTRAGVSTQEAQRRVEEFVADTDKAETKMRAAADTARKAAAEASIYTALSMLIGAFIASVSAALGGRLRDEHP
jgi:hypothetical protein